MADFLSYDQATAASQQLLPEFALEHQGDFVPKMLSGSQAKTAFAIRLNSERMIREDGLNQTGFLTLTVGDYECARHGKQIPEFKDHCPECKRVGKIRRMLFRGVFDADEASRRINSLRGFLLTVFKRAILVTERHKSNAIHFHLLGTLLAGADIRSGFNWEEVKQRRYRSASPALRSLWHVLRDKLPRYGFGRHELQPVRKTGEAVSAYVSKYIEKNVCNRTPADKRKKLVRYIGWQKQQLKPNEFEWDGEKARQWRLKTKQLFAVAGCELRDAPVTPLRRVVEDCASAGGKIRPKMLDGSDIRRKFGARWAMVGTEIWSEVFDVKATRLSLEVPVNLLRCQELLGLAKQKYEHELVQNFRWLKGLVWDEIETMDEMEAKYLWWSMEQMEFEQDYWDATDLPGPRDTSTMAGWIADQRDRADKKWVRSVCSPANLKRN